MDPATVKLLVQLGTYGPLGIMAALGFLLFIFERRKNEKLTEKLLEVSLASIQAASEHSKAYAPLERVFDRAIDVLADQRAFLERGHEDTSR